MSHQVLLAKQDSPCRSSCRWSQVSISIQLEGLGATYEQALDFKNVPPMRRHRETIQLDQIKVSLKPVRV